MPFDDWLIVDDQIVFCTPSTTAELVRQAQHAYEDGADSDAEDGSDASAPADSDRAQKNCYSREKINHAMKGKARTYLEQLAPALARLQNSTFSRTSSCCA